FRPEYRRIRPMIGEIGEYPVIALTATATPKVQHDIQKNLGILGAKVFKSSFNRPNLYYEVRPKTKEVDRDIIRYIKSNPGHSGIIYCLSRKKVEELAETLKINGISCLPYHAGMDASTRSENQDAFLHEKVDIIVATIAFGMGIDKPDVRFVIHYDIPKSLEGYYQETGRAGRDGGGGRCITFYSSKDLQKLDKLMQSKSSNEQEIGRQLLLETAGYAESSVCRRRILLHYFGEEYNEDNCGCCDNCMNPKKQIEAGEELALALELILSSGEKYKQEYLAFLLIGRKTDEVKTNTDETLELFGALKHYEERLCLALLRQAVIAGYLERDLENYGILKVTEAGKMFIDNPVSFKIVEDRDYSDIDTEAQIRGGASCVADPELYAILKDLRKEKSRKHNLPPYVIFQDPSLEAMATTYPITEEELLAIPGVGVGKAKRYGKDFLEVIKRHVEENDIIRPEDIRVRAVPKKNNLKVSIIQAIDRKIDLEELAEVKGLEFSELIDELESIVESGTKIDINYFIEEVMDEDLV
ncbi:MAG: RecQ family ATP-dependent DNA helicase, partial [Muribaculaceae bacterium]|nr:RecQ family ATP-dependent DNA helicase [Muribaculaceae bacterium]